LQAMDVLRPPLVYIGNRCYRKNPVASISNTVEDDYEDSEFTYRDGMLRFWIIYLSIFICSFWPTVLSVEPLVQCVVCRLSVCL